MYNYNKVNFRTDLAVERRDIFRKINNLENEVNGIEVKEEIINNKIKTTKVNILNEEGEKAIGKQKGTYVTIDIKNLKFANDEDIEKASQVLTKELKEILAKYINQNDEILVVGLGNSYVTPDSLGPKVIQDIDVTKHILKYMPEVLPENARPVTAISPGVLGTTGIETRRYIKRHCRKYTP